MLASASSPAPAAAVTALRDDGSVDPAYGGALPVELTVALFEHMVLARAFDERLVALQHEGIVSQHASAVGEEATIVGSAAAMHDEDWVFPSSREFAAALWRGMPLAAYAHHVTGSQRDVGHGRNAPDPPFWKAARVVSGSPLSGNHIPHAVGAAWAARVQKHDVATLMFFGEGATSSAEFHSGLNFAGVMGAPVVAVCRNNGLAMSTPASRQTASAGFAVKAVAYGMRGVRVDGSDVIAVFGVVRDARARAAAGQGPTLIEAVVPGIRVADPVAKLRRHLVAQGLWDDERDRRLAAEVHVDVERAIVEATSAGPPAVETMYSDVFAGNKGAAT
jgi:pyruvate dehydrogenase E1 component alpha subunit